MSPLGAEPSWPLLDAGVRVKSSHHPTQLLSNIAVLRLFLADFGEPLSFAAGVMAAPFAEDDVSCLHFMVRLVDLQYFSFGEAG